MLNSFLHRTIDMYSALSPAGSSSQVANDFPYIEGFSSETISFTSIYEGTIGDSTLDLLSAQETPRNDSTVGSVSLLTDQSFEANARSNIFSDEMLSRSLDSIRTLQPNQIRTSLPEPRLSKPLVLRKRPFSSQLRSSNASRNSALQTRGVSSKQKGRVVNSPFVPLLERMRKVNEQLPERFRVKPSKRTVSPIRNLLTTPKAPRLLTELRSKTHPKPPSPVPPEPFRARPVNASVLRSRGNLGVPRIIKSGTTVPRSPNIGRTRERNTPHPEPRQPLRTASSHRTHIRHSGHKYTVPHPFTFASDKIAALKMQEFDRKVRQQMLEEERARRFKATPMPSFSPKALPKTRQKPTTVPKAFVFAAEARGARYQRLIQQKIDEEGRKRLNEGPTGFRARPAPKLAPVPGVLKSTRLPTVPQPVFLHSAQRVQLRRLYEENVQKKAERQEEIRQRELQAQREREELQLRHLRNQLVPKAHPVPTYHFFQPKKSTRPLTSPHSPNFSKRLRREPVSEV